MSAAALAAAMHQLEQQLHHPPGEPNPVSMEARRAYLIEQMVEMMGRDGGHADAALAEEALKASNWNPEDAQVRGTVGWRSVGGNGRRSGGLRGHRTCTRAWAGCAS